MQQSKVNVLYLSYDGMTDPLGQSQVIPYLQGLTKHGYRFTLISFEKPDRFEKFRDEVTGILQQSNIEWVPLSYTKKPPILSALYDYRRMKSTAFKLHRQKKFSIVHCRSYISALAGLAMKRSLGIKFIFDMRGFYADERVDGKIWNLGNPVYKMVYEFFKNKEKQFLNEADYTISLTEAGKKEIHTWKSLPKQPVPIQVIPCCADLDNFSRKNIDSTKLAALRQSLGIAQSDFVLSYLGSIGTWYMPDEMLDFFKCLLAKQPQAKFLFITNEPAEWILAKAKTKGIPETQLVIKPAARKEVALYLALSNWSLFFIKPVFSKKASSPTKQGEIMGMGIPHVCNGNVGDVDGILREGHAGLVINNFTAAEYNKAIDTMLTATYNADTIVAEAQKVYSLVNGVEKYKQVYERILAGS